MNDYIQFYDDAPLWLRIVLSVLWVPAFLYRLFNVIMEKAQDSAALVYLILNALPIIGTIILVFDIVKCALGKPLPRTFADWSNESVIDVEATEEPKQD